MRLLAGQTSTRGSGYEPLSGFREPVSARAKPSEYGREVLAAETQGPHSLEMVTVRSLHAED